MIRRERPLDVSVVEALHDEAFGALPGRPAGGTQEAAILRGLRADPQAWLPRFSLVATLPHDGGERVVGHVVCSRGTLRDQVPVLALGPIAVAPSAQGNGFGAALVHAVCAAADARDEGLVVLLGDPAFYGRFGFVLAAELGVAPPVPHWESHFQARTLTFFDAAVHHGTFRYAPAFGT
jgi:putative acetyltransferase